MAKKKPIFERVREPITAEFTERRQLTSVGCTQGLSSACTICAFIKVEKTKHEGSPCTKSKCERGFWKGGNSWNRLVPAGM
jgi:hypothetical protein